MLATSNSVRRLNFSDVAHVYTLYFHVNYPRESVHLAGRVGRIGKIGGATGTGGRVTCILEQRMVKHYLHSIKTTFTSMKSSIHHKPCDFEQPSMLPSSIFLHFCDQIFYIFVIRFSKI